MLPIMPCIALACMHSNSDVRQLQCLPNRAHLSIGSPYCSEEELTVHILSMKHNFSRWTWSSKACLRQRRRDAPN